MPYERPNTAFKISVFLIFMCLLLWNLGAGFFPAPSGQGSEPFTPTAAQATGSGTGPVTSTVTDPAFTAEPGSTGSISQPTASETGQAIQPPLPAMFAAGTYAENELVVRFKASASGARIDECFQGIEAQILSEIEQLKTYVITDGSGETAAFFYQVLNCSGVLYVEPNFLLQAADTIPNDPGFGLQYGLANIRAPQGWDYSTGSAGVTIAILDTGVDYGHSDLAGKLASGYDFVNNDENPQDDNGHGTHVAGIAAAASNNGLGIAGVSWGARILPVKVLNAAGGGTYADTAAGVIWAADHGAQIINLSLGGAAPSSILGDAVDYARGRGAVIIAAAGNSGGNLVLFPARHPGVIAVARTNSANQWDGSNYGPEIDLSAPGTSIYSTVIAGYDYKNGSSMSTGFVSGLAALLMGIPGNGNADAVEFQMESTALDIEFPGWDEYTGAGLIQVDAALQLALQPADVSGDESGRPVGAGGGLIQITLTNTATPTWTMSPTLGTQTGTASLTPGPASTISTGTMTIASSTGTESEVEAQEVSETRNYFLPCTGIVLILLGLFLFWMIRRRRQEL